MKKPPAQLELERFTQLANRIRAGYSFGRYKTFEQYLHALGYGLPEIQAAYDTPQLQSAVTIKEINAHLAELKQRILDRQLSTPADIGKPLSLKPEPVIKTGFDLATGKDETVVTQVKIEDSKSHVVTVQHPTVYQKQEVEVVDEAPSDVKHILTDEEKSEIMEHYEKLPKNPKNKASLFEFQRRASARLLYGLLVDSKHGQLLRAPVGSGKTFIIGDVLRHLVDVGFLKRSKSPWPSVYVTRASVVEQTERVLQNVFGLHLVRDVKVINIEQLRASFGQMMVEATTTVKDGEEHVVWKWHKFLNPLIMFLDECQALKNEDSQQSRIMQAYNDL